MGELIQFTRTSPSEEIESHFEALWREKVESKEDPALCAYIAGYHDGLARAKKMMLENS